MIFIFFLDGFISLHEDKDLHFGRKYICYVCMYRKIVISFRLIEEIPRVLFVFLYSKKTVVDHDRLIQILEEREKQNYPGKNEKIE